MDSNFNADWKKLSFLQMVSDNLHLLTPLELEIFKARYGINCHALPVDDMNKWFSDFLEKKISQEKDEIIKGYFFDIKNTHDNRSLGKRSYIEFVVQNCFNRMWEAFLFNEFKYKMRIEQVQALIKDNKEIEAKMSEIDRKNWEDFLTSV